MRAATALGRKEKREAKKSMELGLRLFRKPSRARTAQDKNLPEGAEQQIESGLCREETADDADHPALLVLSLEQSEAGCRWLLDRWNELGSVLESGLAWSTPERFKAIRLMRADTLDLLHAPAVTAVLQACQMLDPDAGDLVSGYWNDLLAANAGWSMEKLREWIPEMSLPADLAAAREELAEIVKSETERLEAELKEYEEEAELESRYSAHTLAFDDSPKGRRMRRYETACNRYVDGFLKESRERGINKPHIRYSPEDHDFVKPRPRALPKTVVPHDSPEKAELNHLMASIHKRDRGQTPESGQAKPAATLATLVQRSAGAEPPVRNEANATGEHNSPQGEANQKVMPEPSVATGPGNGRVLRNEPNPTVAIGTRLGRILRNEPKPAVAGPHRGNKQPKAWDNSRRARRAREAMERANGSRDLGRRSIWSVRGRGTCSCRLSWGDDNHATIRPSWISRTWSWGRMKRRSWVTTTRVQPRFSCCSRSSSKISSPPLRSRFPVGSSASKTIGSLIKARAIATRCCWPPESFDGLWLRRFPSPTCLSRSSALLAHFVRMAQRE